MLLLQRILFVLVTMLILAACTPADPPRDNTPQFLMDNLTLPPPTSSTQAYSAELFAAYPITATLYVVVTPTLPPSKTPSQAATQASGPTSSPTPTADTVTTPTPPIDEYPTIATRTPGFTGPTPAPVACTMRWAFPVPPPGCPAALSTVQWAAYQSFEKNGRISYMLWQSPDIIYVLYADEQFPQWRQFEDTYVEGLDPEYEPGLDYPPEFAPERPSIYHWQARRGFGKLWRDNVTPLDIRERIGWANIQYEVPYTMITQRGQDGVLYMSDPYGRLFGLVDNGVRWTHERYAHQDTARTSPPPTPQTLVPLPTQP